MRRPFRFLALPLVAMAVLLASACADQAEGERCDVGNGNSDCAAGLTCTPLKKLNYPGTSAVCCPTSGATTAVCLGQGATLPEDGGTSGTPTGTGGGASTTDASSHDARADH